MIVYSSFHSLIYVMIRVMNASVEKSSEVWMLVYFTSHISMKGGYMTARNVTDVC